MSLPAGYSSPAFANTPEDRGGWAVVSRGVGLVFILLFASLRLYTRYPFRSRLLYDDLAIIISTAVAIIESALVIAAVSYGLGKSTQVLEPVERDPTEKVSFSQRHENIKQEADFHSQVALRKRSFLPHCYFLFQNCSNMPSLRSEPRTIEQARHKERHYR